MYQTQLIMKKISLKKIPNSWGHQVYDKSYRKLFKDHKMDLLNHKVGQSFLERFVRTYVKKARLKNRLNRMIAAHH